MNKLRNTAYIAVFAAVWGGIEMTLGGLLHTMQIPLRGMIMASIGAFILCSAQLWIKKPFTAVTISMVTAFLKLFSLGGLVISPAVAIIMEGVIAELIFRMLGINLTASIAAGTAAVFYTILHKIVSLSIVYHTEIAEVTDLFLKQTYEEFPARQPLLISLSVYILLHIIVGASMGLLSFISVSKAQKRFIPLKITNNQ